MNDNIRSRIRALERQLRNAVSSSTKMELIRMINNLKAQLRG